MATRCDALVGEHSLRARYFRIAPGHMLAERMLAWKWPAAAAGSGGRMEHKGREGCANRTTPVVEDDPVSTKRKLGTDELAHHARPTDDRDLQRHMARVL